MVSKTMAVAIALAMMAGSAQASMQVENFIIFANDPSADNFKLMVFYQLWAFLIPIFAGPIHVFLYHLWFNMTQTQSVADPDGANSTDLTFTYGQALGFIGFGNYDQLFELFMGLAPKILIKTFQGAGLLGDQVNTSYGSLEQSLIEQMSLCDLTGCDTCTCT